MSFEVLNTYILEEVLEKLIDYRGKTPVKTTAGIPMITAKVIKNGFIEEPNEFIAESDYVEWMRRGMPQYDDVVLTTEAPLGEVAQIKTHDKIALAQRVITLRGKKGILDSSFLKYYLQSPIGQQKLKEKETGTTVTGIKQSELRKIEIEIPDYKTQRRIAAILSALDDKIELNRRMNRTLEAIAQAIFREWFVRFNFPGATGEMVETELGEVPKGWRVGKVENVCEVNQSTLGKSDTFDWIDYVEISGVDQGSIGSTTRYNFGDEPSRARRRIKHGDTVLSTVRPSRGSYFLAINPAPTTIVSTGFAVFSPKNVPYCFLYLLLTDDKKLEYYGHVADGGAYPAINPSLIMDMDLVIPDDESLALFGKTTEPFFEIISNNLSENQSLTHLRDSLLPKLMRGELLNN